ncbi:MAG TPA: hypothetical protein DCM62_10790 [Bacteroidales bacterium]|nr:hypothetical protein [Bacteroidales bacterium]
MYGRNGVAGISELAPIVRRHSKTMTKNGLDIQTISTKRTDLQTDHFLLFGQVTEKKEKALPSHFLKFLFADPHCTHWQAPQANPLSKACQRVQPTEGSSRAFEK